MDSPIVISWVSPLSFLGVVKLIFDFLSHFSMKFLCANRIVPDGTPRPIWGYSVCLRPIKGTPGLYELRLTTLVPELVRFECLFGSFRSW